MSETTSTQRDPKAEIARVRVLYVKLGLVLIIGSRLSLFYK